MVSTRIIKSRVFIAITPALLMIIAMVGVYFGSASQLPSQRALVSPADLRARQAFQSNWKEIMAQSQADKAAAQIPLTGNSSGLQAGMSQRAIQAYSERLTVLANQQAGMSQRATDAYSARLNSLAGLETGMSQRALDAYSARMKAVAGAYQSLLHTNK